MISRETFYTLWFFAVALPQVEGCRHLEIHAANSNPDCVRPLPAEARNVKVVDVLAVHVAVELASVLGLDARAEGPRRGKRRWGLAGPSSAWVFPGTARDLLTCTCRCAAKRMPKCSKSGRCDPAAQRPKVSTSRHIISEWNDTVL